MRLLSEVSSCSSWLSNVACSCSARLPSAAAERRGVIFEHVLQLLGAPADGSLEAADAGGERGLEHRQVFAGAFDDLGELHLLVGKFFDQRRDLARPAASRLSLTRSEVLTSA